MAPHRLARQHVPIRLRPVPQQQVRPLHAQAQIRQHHPLRRRRRRPRPQGLRRPAARLLHPGLRGRRRASAVRRPDRLRHRRGSPGAGRRTGRRLDPDRRGPGQPRLRERHAGEGVRDPHRGRRARARWRGLRDRGRGHRGHQGLRRRLRPRLAGRVGRTDDQAVREGGAERGDEAGGRARQAAHLAPHRVAALLAGGQHRAGRAGGDLSFLGSSRLEDPLLRYPVDAVFHGHAHRGTPEGRTINGIPVYNVARPLLLRKRPDRAPFWLYELPREQATAEADVADTITAS